MSRGTYYTLAVYYSTLSIGLDQTGFAWIRRVVHVEQKVKALRLEYNNARSMALSIQPAANEFALLLVLRFSKILLGVRSEYLCLTLTRTFSLVLQRRRWWGVSTAASAVQMGIYSFPLCLCGFCGVAATPTPTTNEYLRWRVEAIRLQPRQRQLVGCGSQ